jgi:hypothetical protein
VHLAWCFYQTLTQNYTTKEPARISSKYKLVEARVEEQAQLNCDAEGEQSVSLVWLDKDGKQIDKNDKRFM